MIGRTLGSYVLQRELGRGGMGAVFVGKHALLGRDAAVKVLLPQWSKDQAMVQRFFNEARAATAIKHPGIVEVYDFGFAEDGSAYIVMEFLEGEPLSARIRQFGKLAPAFVVAVARQVVTALGVAHKAGIVHRDLKPDNVFLCPDPETSIGERVKLLDFGIAKLTATGDGTPLAKTSTGAIMGTPYYMSPEQCRGAGQVDARSDLYALGCMLYEMVCGRVPFVAEGAGDILAAHLLLPPQPLSAVAPDVPKELEALVMRLLAKQPGDRPADADACAEELQTVMLGLGIGRSRPPVVTPALAPQAKLDTMRELAVAPRALPQRRRRPRGLAIGLAVLVVAGAGAGVVVATRGSSTAVAPDAGVISRPTPPGDDLHLIALRTAIETQMWTEAVVEADAVLRADPDNDEAKQLGARARSEGQAQVAAHAMAEAIAAEDLITAAARFAAIPDGSFYQAPAMRDLIAGRERFVVGRTPDVKALIAGGRCADAAAMVSELEQAAGTGPTEPLRRAVTQCKPKKPKGSGSAAPPPAVPDSNEQVFETAKRRAIDGDHRGALSLYDAILERDPDNVRAKLDAAIVAGLIPDCKAALRYVRGLDGAKADRVRAKCR